ncbi:hypothetical protein H6P81_007160 [Aristolochia fimbriata]|uniref:cytokinin dehydrogenase n=1 Tax=Aristolochia fimbriata TaxID=158543 RepID=A0AAV7F257_ARIFI|nr:hypothetical protein H6P81_007160 [Aristolochia fimbriata]
MRMEVMGLLRLQAPTPSDTTDFGRIVVQQPCPLGVCRPKSAADVCLLLRTVYSSSSFDSLTVAPRGAGHSAYGQAQAPGGIVVVTTSLPRSIAVGSTSSFTFVDVDGGALWVEVLEETLKHGLAPKSWTDYLYLTVGGTLSVGGISGQTFKHGPQICNVLEIDVVTGRGQFVTCSETENSNLFYGVLGGLGQFGVISRARIVLQTAPKMVKWVKISYYDFDDFIEDEELLISMEDVDYLEGFVRLHGISSSQSFTARFGGQAEDGLGRGPTYYYIEMALHYDNEAAVTKTLESILPRLKFVEQMASLDVPYFDFLNRVRAEELKGRSKGVWDVPHPWQTMFVPRSRIKQYKDLLLETISETPRDGPIILCPLRRHKWNEKMSTVLPRDDAADDIFYVVSLLRSIPCPDGSSDSPQLRKVLQQNKKMIQVATGYDVYDHLISTKIESQPGALEVASQGRYDNNIGAKQYMPYCEDEQEWMVHFGEKWEMFRDLKNEFDPLNVLAPGQRIFKRKRLGDLWTT